MRRIALLVVAAQLVVSVPVWAQHAGQNTNVLPIFFGEDAQLKGDGYLQRQVEPTVAASTRNPDHLLAFFNDYRAVDVPDDPGLGEVLNIAAALVPLRMVMASLWGGTLPSLSPPPAPIVAAEAWVGMSRSYDGGLTWSGGLLPGAPFDTSPASLAAPVHGLEAATDPVLAAGPCGSFYLAFIAFTRGGQSMMTVARYEDLNNSETGDTIRYGGMTVLEIGNNATNGYFLDKPHLVVDVARNEGRGWCGHNVYASYTTFNGLDKDGKFQSKLTFARSVDGGLSFDVRKFNMPTNQNQGTAIAVDPRPGTPATTGGGTVYVVWRHFFSPDAMFMVSSADYGSKFSKPVEITAGAPMAPFDQPTLATDRVANPLTDIAFRSNGFPSAVVTGEGRILVAWQERVDLDPQSAGFAAPDPFGSPRIVVARSDDKGTSWTDVHGHPGRRAVDLGDRDVPGSPNLPPPGFGALPQQRPSGPQVMPKLSFGGGRLMLAYYESRGLLGVDAETGEEVIQGMDISPTTGFISGYHRVLDLRAALLDPATGQLLSTTQVSRYPIRAGADLGVEELADVAPVNPPCWPDDLEATVACVRQVNRSNVPQSGAGTSPFIGDYIDVTPTVSFVAGAEGWRWATVAGDVPARGFHAVFADNRHVRPPDQPGTLLEIERYPFYGPPAIGGPCVNAGSRNTDVLTARVDAELIVSAPTTFKQLDVRRGFPLSVHNATGVDRFYRLTLTDGAAQASFAVDPGSDVDQGDVRVFPFSSVSQVVHVDAGSAGPIRVEIVEIDGIGDGLVPGGQRGAVVFNPDPDNPVLPELPAVEHFEPELGDAFVLNPVPDNAFVLNAFVLNPFVLNGSVDNAFVLNAFVLNPSLANAFVLNTPIYDVVDTTWTVDAGSSNTASSYLPLVNIDDAQAMSGDYAFQLIVHKDATYATFEGDESTCQAYAVNQGQVLSNVFQGPDSPENAFVLNPELDNAFVLNPFVDNAFVLNSTFTMAPSDAQAAKSAELADDGTTKAPRPPSSVRITLRAYQLVPDDELERPFDPHVSQPASALLPVGCDPVQDPAHCVVSISGADLLPELGDPGLLTAPLQADRCGSFDFPPGGWVLHNQGNVAANPPTGGALHHGIYLSVDDEIGGLSPDGDPATGDLLLAQIDSEGVDAGAALAMVATSLELPKTVVAGSYYLILSVDHDHLISEVDELNNSLAVELAVTSFPFGFLGLQTPWTAEPVYAANAGSVIPLAWQYTDPATGVVVESAWMMPEVHIMGPFPCALGEDQATVETVLDPGSSDYRYSASTATHRFNWQSKALELGCFNIWVRSEANCQEDGPFLVRLQ